MTYFDLKSLQRRIEEQKLTVRQLRENACCISQNISGMPQGGEYKDKLSIAVSKIDEAENKQRLLESEFEQAIYSIKDSYIRKIITCKLKYKWSWTKIAVTLGGNNTGDGVRMMCTRYKW